MSDNPWRNADLTIGFLLLPRFSMLELFCAVEPLRIARRLQSVPCDWRLVSADGLPVEASNGMEVSVGAALSDIRDLPILFTCASFEPERRTRPQDLAGLRRLARHGTLMGAIDTGPFILARAGLLEDRRITLHWESIAAFRHEFPDIPVAASIFEMDRDRLTCAGGTAPIDMMLHLIALQRGDALARAIADQIVYPALRPGHAPQRLDAGYRHQVREPTVRAAIDLMERTPDRNLPVGEIAATVGVSQRRLERLFRDHVGQTAKAFHVQMRLEHARQFLVDSHGSVADAAMAAGFDSLAHFSRIFRRRYGTLPSLIGRMR